MADKDSTNLKSILRHHPLLVKLSDMAFKEANVRLSIVFPDETGWVQCLPGGKKGYPRFCSMIQSVPEGAKQCKMCHILMTVAACSSGATEQKCHAGACSIICPINPPGHEQSQAVLSSCTFVDESRDKSWEAAKTRAEQLGLDVAELREAFYELPVLNPAETKKIHAFLSIAAEAIKVLLSQATLQNQLKVEKNGTKITDSVQDTVTARLRALGAESQNGSAKTRHGKLPPIISVIQETVNKRPDFHYSVGEIAAAARMTPNHFSALFRKHTGRTFSDFVTKRRLAKAKQLLADFTLNISEVSSKAGFDDPGYFARRFRQIEGCAPREWREQLR